MTVLVEVLLEDHQGLFWIHPFAVGRLGKDVLVGTHEGCAVRRSVFRGADANDPNAIGPFFEDALCHGESPYQDRSDAG